MRKKSILLLCIVFGALFFSCANAVPPRGSESSTMLVIWNDIVSELSPSVKYELFLDYRLYVEGSNQYITINSSSDYIFFTKLSPGEYKINRMLVYFKNTNKTVREHKLNIFFELKPGKITLLPIATKTIVKRNTDKTVAHYYQSWQWFYVPFTKKNQIKEELKADYKNTEMWEFAN